MNTVFSFYFCLIFIVIENKQILNQYVEYILWSNGYIITPRDFFLNLSRLTEI